MPPSSTEIALVAELNNAGFRVTGPYTGAARDYLFAAQCEWSGRTMPVIVTAGSVRNGQHHAWRALIDGITETAQGDTAAELAEHADSLIALYSSESRFDFAHDNIRQIIQRRPLREPDPEAVKVIEDALGLLERVFFTLTAPPGLSIPMTMVQVWFIADLTAAGFTIRGPHYASGRDYFAAASCARAGRGGIAVLLDTNMTWTAQVDRSMDTELSLDSDDAQSLGERIDTELGISRPEDKFAYVQGSIRSLVRQRPQHWQGARPETRMDVKYVEDALGLLERVFGEA